jgi:protein phosphatase 2C
MAENCCEETRSTPPPAATAAAAVSATAAAVVAVASSALERRRRRLAMKRFRVASDLEPPSPEDVRAGKRQRRARTASGPCPPDAGVDVEKPPSELDRMPRFGVSSVCGRRREMEDAVSIRPDFLPGASKKHHFFSVFDGHGCSHVSHADTPVLCGGFCFCAMSLVFYLLIGGGAATFCRSRRCARI